MLCGTDEQFKLTRIANAAIDIYAMVVVLSRASRTLQLRLPSSAHEEAICKLFCDDVSFAL